MKKFVLASLLAIFSINVNAHLVFPAKQGDDYVVKLWADDHWEEIKPNQVISLHGYVDGKKVKVGYDYQNGYIEVTKKPQLLTTEYRFGYYTFTADKHFAQNRNDVSGIIYDTRKIYKLGKGLYSWNPAYSKPVGMKLEVTPLHNPLKLKVGDKLKVRITFNGKPFTQVEFEDQAGDLDDLKINTDGIAEVVLRKPQNGWFIIGATTKLPYQLTDDNAETLQLTATLAFPDNE